MRRFKKRLQKKYIKRAADGIRNGTITPFYAKRAADFINWYIDWKYLTEFRPWWYSDIDLWKTLDLTAEHLRFFKKWEEELEAMSGIDTKALNDYYKALPKRRKLNPKPRKEKPVQIRQLRNPEWFPISVRRGNGVEIEYVKGEKIFEVEGYGFFIHHDGHQWVVSDIAMGYRLAWHTRYKRAVELAKEKMDKYFSQYKERVEKAG